VTISDRVKTKPTSPPLVRKIAVSKLLERCLAVAGIYLPARTRQFDLIASFHAISQPPPIGRGEICRTIGRRDHPSGEAYHAPLSVHHAPLRQVMLTCRRPIKLA
jgi:hypothetical protein